MALDRRSLLKKGALAGLLTAGAAALGIANAPAAQASWGSNLTYWRNTYGSHIYLWRYGGPRWNIGENPLGSGWRRSYGPRYEEWIDYVTGNGGAWASWNNWGTDEWGGSTGSWRWAPAYALDSVKMLQSMLNRMVEVGYLGGSYIAADGIYGDQTHYKVGDYQIKAGLAVDGITGYNTWTSLASNCGMN